MSEPVLDMLGKEIREGDTVAYAVRHGNTGELKVGRVLSARWVPKMDGGYPEVTVEAFADSGYPRGYVRKSRPSKPSVHKMVKIGASCLEP
jgi:hypothetical protein